MLDVVMSKDESIVAQMGGNIKVGRSFKAIVVDGPSGG
jgi:hypothetical protein